MKCKFNAKKKVVVLSVAVSAVLMHSMAEEQGSCREMVIESH